MKKSILSFIVIFSFTQCLDKQIPRGMTSVVGSLSISELLNFHLQKDTIQVEVDTLGYFFVSNPPVNRGKLRTAVKNAEIFMLYPDGKLLSSLSFGTAKSNKDGFKITLQGSPNPLFNRIMTLAFVDSFALATVEIPFYEDGKIVYSCHLRTDSLQVKLNKYPANKGDIVKGHLAYKGWKECIIREDNNRIVGEPLIYDGYFECKVE